MTLDQIGLNRVLNALVDSSNVVAIMDEHTENYPVHYAPDEPDPMNNIAELRDTALN